MRSARANRPAPGDFDGVQAMKWHSEDNKYHWGGTATALLATMLVMVTLLAGCASREMDSFAGGLDEPNPVQGAALGALAEGHHKRADLALQQGQRQEAKAEMERLLTTAEPYRGNLPEGWDVIFDAATRLAHMHREDGKLEDAERVARDGLRDEDKAPTTIFRGYLHQELGNILEARKDMRGAVEEHGRAIELFKVVLDEHAPPRPPASDPPQTPPAQDTKAP